MGFLPCPVFSGGGTAFSKLRRMVVFKKRRVPAWLSQGMGEFGRLGMGAEGWW